MTTRRLVPILLLIMAFSGCGGGDASRDESAGTAQSRPASEGRRGPSRRVAFTAPEGWVAEEPSGSMRLMQFRLPNEGVGDAELVVFKFAGGGSAAANIRRWKTQFRGADGGEEPDGLAERTREVDGMKVSVVEIEGTYVAPITPMSQERRNDPDYAMIGAVIESDHGPYFIKAIGPKATIAKWKASIEGFIDSARRQWE